MALTQWNNGWETCPWDDEKFDLMVVEMNGRIKMQKVSTLMRFQRILIKQKFQKRDLAERMNKKNDQKITTAAERKIFLKQFINVSTINNNLS